MTLSSNTEFEIRALAVWGRARYLSVTEAPHTTDINTCMGKKHFCLFQTVETGNRTPNSGVKGCGANHYPRAPAHYVSGWQCHLIHLTIVRRFSCLSLAYMCTNLALKPPLISYHFKRARLFVLFVFIITIACADVLLGNKDEKCILV